MSQYKIVIDSCGELPEDLKADGHFCTVPLLLDVDGYQITDDETFNQRDRGEGKPKRYIVFKAYGKRRQRLRQGDTQEIRQDDKTKRNHCVRQGQKRRRRICYSAKACRK